MPAEAADRKITTGPEIGKRGGGSLEQKCAPDMGVN